MSAEDFDGPRWLYPVAYVYGLAWVGAVAVTVAVLGLLITTRGDKR